MSFPGPTQQQEVRWAAQTRGFINPGFATNKEPEEGLSSPMPETPLLPRDASSMAKGISHKGPGREAPLFRRPETSPGSRWHHLLSALHPTGRGISPNKSPVPEALSCPSSLGRPPSAGGNQATLPGEPPAPLESPRALTGKRPKAPDKPSRPKQHHKGSANWLSLPQI